MTKSQQPFYEVQEQEDGRFLITRDGKQLPDAAFETALEATRHVDEMIELLGGYSNRRSPYQGWYGRCPTCKRPRGLSIMRTEGYVVHECGNPRCEYEKRIRPLS